MNYADPSGHAPTGTMDKALGRGTAAAVLAAAKKQTAPVMETRNPALSVTVQSVLASRMDHALSGSAAAQLQSYVSGRVYENVSAGTNVLGTVLDMRVNTLTLLNRDFCSAGALRASAIRTATNALLKAKPLITPDAGDEAHIFLQWYFLTIYGMNPEAGIYGGKEVPVPTGCPTPTGSGFADMVLFNIPGTTLEVYEIKPLRHHGNPLEIPKDRAQLNGYITGLKALWGAEFTVVPGTTFYPVVDIPSALNPGWFIRYYTFERDGFIYWDYVKTPREEHVWVPVAVPEKEPAADVDWLEFAWALVRAVGIVAAIAIIIACFPECIPLIPIILQPAY